MTESYVLDTSIVLSLFRGKALGTEIDRAFGLSSSMRRHVVSIVTQAELQVIADRNNWGPQKRAALQNALDNLVIVPVDGTELVQAYVSISHADFTSPNGSRNMGKNDIWIAATALYTELPLLTTDKDFRFLDGDYLRVMWIDPSGA